MYDAQIQDADIHMPHKSDRDYPIRSSLKQAKKIYNFIWQPPAEKENMSTLVYDRLLMRAAC